MRKGMKPVRMQVEYLSEPVGIDIRNPRFYWNCEGGVKQTAYRIVAESSGEVLWDSGKVPSRSMTHIAYGGEYHGVPKQSEKPGGRPLSCRPLHSRLLRSREIVMWSLQLWDEFDEPGEIGVSSFEMGLLEPEDWSAKWISGDYKPAKNTRYPADNFRRIFELHGTVKKARLYITACGIYEVYLNGKRAGDFALAPGNTDCRERLQYQTYDVTGLLTEAERRTDGTQSPDGQTPRAAQILTVDLADGWYRGSVGCFGPTNVFGRRTKLLCQLEIEYTDGTGESVASDSRFEWSNDGPVRFSDLKDGEIVEAFRTPSFCGKAVEVEETLIPSSSNNVPVRRKESFTPELLITPSGKKVLDFGQNIAGFAAFRVCAEKGSKIKLTLGEILTDRGEFTQENIQVQKPVKEYTRLSEVMAITGNLDRYRGEKTATPRQEIIFYCSGSPDEYETRFAVFGFRYALVETEIAVIPEDFRAIAVYSDMEQAGEFTCSNEKVNRLVRNTVWSMKGNFLDVPTDCPARERLGWTGDAQIFFHTGAYLMNTAPFYRKWLLDMKDNQNRKGRISAVVPYNGCSIVYDSTGASVGWGDAAVLVPYRFWKRYGDLRILEENYGVMKGYAEYMIRHTGHRNKKKAKENPFNQFTYEKGMHLGEWLEPEEFQDKITAGSKSLHTEECTAYLHYTMKHMEEASRALGKEEDAARYGNYAEGAKQAYEWLFLRNGIPDTDRQAKLVRPLAFGLAEGETLAALEKRLIRAVQNRNYCVMTGFLSTPFLLDVLTDLGRPDLAWQMLLNEERPGWLYEVNRGATTVWENWEGDKSNNHYSPGSVCQWLFETAAGIRVESENRFTVRPVPGGGLKNVKCSYLSPYGRITSSWEKTENEMLYEIEIPANTSACVILPDGTGGEAGPGMHQYRIGC